MTSVQIAHDAAVFDQARGKVVILTGQLKRSNLVWCRVDWVVGGSTGIGYET